MRLVIEVEVADVAKLDAHVVGLLGQLKAAVEGSGAAPKNGVAPTNGNGHAPATPQKTSTPAPVATGNGEGHLASQKQKGLVLGLASRRKLMLADVNQMAKDLFGPDAHLHNITKQEASTLIDQLKAEASPTKGE